MNSYINNSIGPSTAKARHSLEMGAQFPYDAPDAWRDSDDPPPSAPNWQMAAARGIIANLTDRRGIKQGFEGVDEDVRREIVAAIALIIDVALPWYAEQSGWIPEPLP